MTTPLPAGVAVLERGWLSSNNVLLHGLPGEGAVLVDSGHCLHAPQTLALVRQALAGAPLARIVNTHLHSDQCGGNGAECQLAHGAGVGRRCAVVPRDRAAVRALHGAVVAGAG
jgi:glyoxylase-like metal-dependent hydrolase (beta-lactamase superfamily II)